ncbi:hypothetical protein [Acinetobacter sp. LoGeW2-3]|uniref:hypothetical protein n=1 Tax=Acinetobacter sp. LoGeW2-3 TaxID=1808001 RepID=UPI00148AB7DA|nr:hypothetical protein [Acinetobacter sp. LoGeW2-3]
MLNTLKNILNLSAEHEAPSYLQDAAQKMQLTIDRLENTANLNLFKTDYLE